MHYFHRHTDALAQRGMRVNRLADIDGICTHFNCQGHLANHVARVGADHAAAQNQHVISQQRGKNGREVGSVLIGADESAQRVAVAWYPVLLTLMMAQSATLAHSKQPSRQAIRDGKLYFKSVHHVFLNHGLTLAPIHCRLATLASGFNKF
jgi:hypothetical protein